MSFDRITLERAAFRNLRAEYYREDVVQGEPLKGNFTNVARTRTTGTLLGPTNHHGYQPALRKFYEERYSRRMSFQEFVQREVEVVTDEQTIAQWKENARSTTTFVTLKEEEPITFKSAAEAEEHFKKTYLPGLLKSGTTLECSGQASRSITDRGIANAIRDAWEKERAFPAQLVNHLRPYLLEAGLHFFKHRKRVLYISAVKPARHSTGHALTENVAAIIKTIESSPRCTRRDLAAKILGENHDAPEMLEQKAALARDLHYLIHAGHVIEFHDGILDLPLVPGQPQPPQGQKGQARNVAAAAAPEAEPAPEGEEAFAEEEFLSAEPSPEGSTSTAGALTGGAEGEAEVSQSFSAESDAQQDAPLQAAVTASPELTESAGTTDVEAGASTTITTEPAAADLSIEALVAPQAAPSEPASFENSAPADQGAAQVADHLSEPAPEIPVDAPVIDSEAAEPAQS